MSALRDGEPILLWQAIVALCGWKVNKKWRENGRAGVEKCDGRRDVPNNIPGNLSLDDDCHVCVRVHLISFCFVDRDFAISHCLLRHGRTSRPSLAQFREIPT
jgi:hypothetical protein